MILGMAGRAIYKKVKENRDKKKTGENGQHPAPDQHAQAPPPQGDQSFQPPPPAYSRSQSSTLSPDIYRSRSGSDASAQSWIFSAPLTIIEFFPTSSTHLPPALPLNDPSSGRHVLLLTYPPSTFENRQLDYANALPNCSAADPPTLVLNGRIDASHSRDLQALIAEDSAGFHASDGHHVELRKQPDGGMLVSGSSNPGDSSRHGSLMILAIRYDPVGGSNLVRDVVNIGRWQGGETVVTVPPMTGERDRGCETICVVQEAGAGGIAGGSEV